MHSKLEGEKYIYKNSNYVFDLINFVRLFVCIFV